MTAAEILALPTSANPRLIVASDTSVQYIIAAGAAGAAATALGNATVPEDAPIQPPQAFVDNIVKFTDPVNDIIISDPTLTFIDTSGDGSSGFLERAANIHANENGAPVFVITAALPVDVINGFLNRMVVTTLVNGYLDLSGGTNAAPTGQGITDKATLITAGWTVTTN